ncbi:phosphate-starvation-inducible protein PsiE [Methylobacillus glycogenes]|uniref:phosphate-starvation-inducible protein PsiE n=1 Tax=Methylobacillus glycogenes TaxID=406 RepID=UPI00046EFC0B|nr:phosphate-starvation-inducible PsiE family protein [Methylobacillus glycogenes]MBL8504873.1 phosphate-starvation-inducible PsiE family protein [Methylobacillus glycogenes]
MQPNKFSKIGQHGIGFVEQAMLIFITIATIVATGQAVAHIWVAGAVTVADLLLLFLYLEILTMLNHYLGSGNLPVRYPLYIGIIALARYLVLDIKELEAWRIFAVSASILLIAVAILVVRYGHVKFPYSDGHEPEHNHGPDHHSK